METAQLENVLDHTKNPADFMDTSYYNDALSGLDYLQYPHSPFGVSSMGCEYPDCHYNSHVHHID